MEIVLLSDQELIKKYPVLFNEAKLFWRCYKKDILSHPKNAHLRRELIIQGKDW